MNTTQLIEMLKANDLLRIIDEPLDINLEIPHIAYIEVKKPDSRALLFTRPIDKKHNKKFDMPVLMNIFGSHKAVRLLIGDIDKISQEISGLFKLKPPAGFIDRLKFGKKLFDLKYLTPKRLKTKGKCQEIIKLKEHINLGDIPVLTTWEQDGGPFITTGQVYTTSIDGTMSNVGLYRLQIYDDKTVGLHWQIHKDANHFFHEYKKAKKPMPVSIAIGGDPLYVWCAQAPLPIGIFELLLYGFIKKQNAKLVKSITNDIYVPFDVDVVIEGFVDTSKMKTEGPFGDHTGYYTLQEQYPVLDVTAITYQNSPTFTATVVGKPPLEDKYMGYATSKIFLPLLQTTAPDMIDYFMPENGVFHNLILVKLDPKYPNHSQQMMHAFWGVGQMSFVKHAIFVDSIAPCLEDGEAITRWILDRFDPKNMLITSGVLDALDHSSNQFASGGKLGVDATCDKITNDFKPQNDDILYEKLKVKNKQIVACRQFAKETSNPITVLKIDKILTAKDVIDDIKQMNDCFKIVVLIDDKRNNLDYPYMIVWRVANNIDAQRDIYNIDGVVYIDATNKTNIDGFSRRWPHDVECSKEVLDSLRQRGIVDIDDDFVEEFAL